jgi:hypothetical protein
MNHARPHGWQKERKMQTEWRSFQGGAWETEVNVRDFIQKNYHSSYRITQHYLGISQDERDEIYLKLDL